MLCWPEGSPQAVSTSVLPLQTQKVGSHLGVLLPQGSPRRERQCSLEGVKQRISLQLHLHPILLVAQFINMQDRGSSLSLPPTKGLKLGLTFTFYFWFFSAQTENCFYSFSLLVPETLKPAIQGCSQMYVDIAGFNPQQRHTEWNEPFAKGWYVSGQPEFITVM